MEIGYELSWYLRLAWLLPLAGFAVEVFAGYWSNRHSKTAAYLATGCIAAGFVLSTTAFIQWGSHTHWDVFAAHDHAAGDHGETTQAVFSGTIYTLGAFGDLEITIDYYIDSLTLLMFMMVTLIATCIHIFAIGYMSDELTDEYVDHSAHTSDGHHVHRPGRFYRFFSFMSLFCFAMLPIQVILRPSNFVPFG